MNIQENIDLTHCNTFGLPVKSQYFYKLTDKNDLAKLVEHPIFKNNKILFLGGGSNIIFAPDFLGLTVFMSNKGVKVVEQQEDSVIIEAQAGENWHNFVLSTIRLGLNGLENLSLIPGTVGASPVQNIGAYGVEVKDVIEKVECFDLETQEWLLLTNTECRFDYRDSIFKQHNGRYVITSVYFKLSKTFIPKVSYGLLKQYLGSQETALSAKTVSEAICQIRQEKLPNPERIGNAGSFFKNPIISANQAKDILALYPNAVHYHQPDGMIKFAAGWLIEEAGLKGVSVGGAAVHQKQALVLINQDHASVEDVKSLAKMVQKTILYKYGLSLEAEPLFVE
ncbi:UDP-N-acetylmuramate dehydrogenase [Neisseria sp. Ec49-e6-T10]|uniref:UDP-N-acetylmuramate dehydrogenase n=1 Tax=Neisseria sp. Ec49-e6-T10 TaxID=3140744 RepID=UPI003EB6FE77